MIIGCHGYVPIVIRHNGAVMVVAARVRRCVNGTVIDRGVVSRFNNPADVVIGLGH